MRLPPGSRLRLIDFGRVSPLRSQTLWHAVAHGVSAGAPPTLSFVRPTQPYVCLGYHRRLDEVDDGYCAAQGLPIYRRMVGGGPVYLDSDQLFFQICLPARAVSPSRVSALRDLLTPAVAAYRAVGIPAELDGNLEICVGDAKICGHGAGQIEDAVVVCGNLIERFDHERATAVLRLPNPAMRAEVLRLMRRYVRATPVDPVAFQQAAVDAYAAALGSSAVTPAASLAASGRLTDSDAIPGELTEVERTALVDLDATFGSEGWIAGPRGLRRTLEHSGVAASHASEPGTRTREVKIRAGRWVFAAEHGGAAVVASVVDDTVERAQLRTPVPHHGLRTAEAALTGSALAEAQQHLAGLGATGRRLAAAFAAADGKRL